jgi:hypothetical protein
MIIKIIIHKEKPQLKTIRNTQEGMLRMGKTITVN